MYPLFRIFYTWRSHTISGRLLCYSFAFCVGAFDCFFISSPREYSFARDFKCTPTKNLAMSIVMISHYANRRVRKSRVTIRVANCHLRKEPYCESYTCEGARHANHTFEAVIIGNVDFLETYIQYAIENHRKRKRRANLCFVLLV